MRKALLPWAQEKVALLLKGHKGNRGPQDLKALQGCQVKECRGRQENSAHLVPRGTQE